MGVPDVPLRVITHRKLVCNLYKRSYRALESKYDPFQGREKFRVAAVILRDRFDKNRNVSESDGKKLIQKGESELFRSAPHQLRHFASTYGGLLHNRDEVITDAVLDFYHPLEKAQYPEYFTRREKRKLEFIEWWEKTYGKTNKETGKGH